MSARSDELVCTDCGRRFLSDWVLRTRHRHHGRCRTDRQMQAIGLHLNDDGYWTRTDTPASRPPKLFPGRPGRPRSARSVLRGSRERAVSWAGRPTDQEPLPGVVWEPENAA